MRPALPFQREAIGYCSRTEHPALFMEMRLGKTLVAIRACRGWGSRRVLVLAPLSVLKAWEAELVLEGEDWISSPASDVLDLEHPPRGKTSWVLVNFERLLASFKRCDTSEWERWANQFDAVIVDESVSIKNPKAKTTKVITTAFRRADHRMILTGLPAPETPLDYVEQFRFLYGWFMGCRKFWTFRNRFFEPLDYDWVPKAGTRERIKKEVARLAFVLSRKDAGVGSRKIYSRRYIEPTREQSALMDQVEGEFRLGETETKFSLVIHTWLGRISGGHGEDWNCISERKGREILSLLQGELKREPVLIFFRFNAELRLTARLLREARIPYTSIIGETEPGERARRRLLFQKGRVRVALVQIKVCRYGLDFSRSSTAIYYSNSFSLNERKQSEDRIIHPLKREPLLYIDLITRDSLDESVSEALRIKDADSKFFLRKLFQLERNRINARRLRHA